MKVHWADKWMSIQYSSKQVLLQGVLPNTNSGQSVQLLHIASSSDSVTPAVAPEVQLLLNQFSSLFAEPKGLPSQRLCDHTIPLVEGVQPVAVRPYQYAPASKMEIEK
jgi:hypothetical protein